MHVCVCVSVCVCVCIQTYLVLIVNDTVVPAHKHIPQNPDGVRESNEAQHTLVAPFVEKYIVLFFNHVGFACVCVCVCWCVCVLVCVCVGVIV